MRRGDPERIYQAQRTGMLRRLLDAERVSELDAERLLTGWEGRAAAEGMASSSPGYWDAAWRWIDQERPVPLLRDAPSVASLSCAKEADRGHAPIRFGENGGMRQ